MLTIGMILVMLGVMMGDSESLVVPTLFIAAGIALISVGKRKGSVDDAEQ